MLVNQQLNYTMWLSYNYNIAKVDLTMKRRWPVKNDRRSILTTTKRVTNYFLDHERKINASSWHSLGNIQESRATVSYFFARRNPKVNIRETKQIVAISKGITGKLWNNRRNEDGEQKQDGVIRVNVRNLISRGPETLLKM